MAADETETDGSVDPSRKALGGSAGAILGLLALYEALPDLDVLHRAVCAGST